ncbi:MAG: HAD family hydrolase [Pseudomonadota bacterium]
MKLVIFDCDGVLVDSEPITNRLIAEEMTAHGLPMTTEQSIELFVGGTIKSVFERARGMGAALPDGWVEGYYDLMIATLADEVEIIPGIAGVLDVLDTAGIPYCVGSNGPMRKMHVTLKKTGLWERLEGRIYSAHDVGIAKPDPGLYLHAAAAMGIAPGDAVVIEDSASGVRAAVGAGMRCYGYSRDTPEEKLVAHGAIPFDDMKQLPELLGLSGRGNR